MEMTHIYHLSVSVGQQYFNFKFRVFHKIMFNVLSITAVSSERSTED